MLAYSRRSPTGTLPSEPTALQTALHDALTWFLSMLSSVFGAYLGASGERSRRRCQFVQVISAMAKTGQAQT